MSLWTLVTLAHVVGFALAIGAATVKVVLLLKAKSNDDFLPAYFKVAKLITRVIVLGLILATLSGIAWIIQGIEFTAPLVVKLVAVAGVWFLGAYMDIAVAPKLEKSAPEPGGKSSPEFVRLQKRHFLLESIATGLFYVAAVIGVLV